jgi:hypothetical protein
MKNHFLFVSAMSMLIFFSCSRNSSGGYVNPTIVGKWILTKSCVCNSCIEGNPFSRREILIFSSGGQVDLSGYFRNVETHYTGTYSIIQQSYGRVLNINLNTADTNKNFLYVPGSVIYFQSGTTLVLNLSTPFANPCLYQNTYAAVAN